MSSSYTGNIGFANPAAGDCNWDNDWHRNQFINDIVDGVLLSTNRVISGGIISDGGGVNVNVAAGSANIGGIIYSWDATVKAASTGAPELEYNSNWLYVDDSGVVQISTTIPTGDFVPLGLADVDQTSVLRVYDLRPMQIDPSILPAINKILSGTDIVDVFIYDTSKDSDLGAWRYKTQGTAWYNEELNTATRGKTRRIPKSSLIIIKTDEITYYDLTDSEVPMWMVFEQVADYMAGSPGNTSSATMLNGILGLTSDSNLSSTCLILINFLSDSAYKHSNYQSSVGTWDGNILQRNSTGGVTGIGEMIVDESVHDVAMTILDSAPIDSETGIKVPTIAAFTDGGVSIIDGPAGVKTVKDITWNNNTICRNGVFDNNENIIISHGDATRDAFIHVYPIPSSDINETNGYDKNTADEFYPTFKTGGSGVDIFLTEIGSLISGTGINDLKSSNKDELFIALESRLLTLKRNTTTPSDGILNRVEDSFLSAQMHGDCKLATLADTVEETIGTDITTEHVTNGTFPANITGWTDNSAAGGVIAWNASGYMDLINTTGTANADQQITTVVGQVYSLSVDETTGINTVDVRVGTSEGGNELVDNITVAVGTTEIITFKATTTSTFIRFTRGSAGTTGVDNVSVKATQSLADNGEFSSDRVWVENNATTVYSEGDVTVTNDGASNGTIAQSIPTTIGIKYLIKTKATNGTGTARVYFGASYIVPNGADVEQIVEATSTSTNVSCLVLGADGDDAIFDYIEIYELAEEDRSVNDNPLQVVGQLEKTAVATSADLVAYSGFSTDDYIEQPYNSDLDYGTGDFNKLFGIKMSANTVVEVIFERDSSATAQRLTGQINTDGTISFICDDDTTVRTATSAGTIDDDIIHEIEFDYSAGTLNIKIDGVLDGTATGAALLTLSNTSAIFRIGLDVQGANPLIHGALTLFRSGAGTPSTDDIKYIYNTEKKLFQENAKCVLTENNVVALSYDEDSNTLKVGNSNGVDSYNIDTFQDLIRIETAALDSEPVAIAHTKDSDAIAEATQVEFNKELINLREFV